MCAFAFPEGKAIDFYIVRKYRGAVGTRHEFDAGKIRAFAAKLNALSL
jgi:hypothetical protein